MGDFQVLYSAISDSAVADQFIGYQFFEGSMDGGLGGNFPV